MLKVLGRDNNKGAKELRVEAAISWKQSDRSVIFFFLYRKEDMEVCRNETTKQEGDCAVSVVLILVESCYSQIFHGETV